MDPIRPPTRDWTLGIILGIVGLGSVWFASSGWDRPLLDRHEFRQIQTAISAHWIKEAGYRFDYETPLFGPPWSFPLEFPIYQFVVGQVSAWLGSGLEPTGRAVNLFFLLAALPAVYALSGLFGFGHPGRLLVTAAVLATPVHLFYARTFLIESSALCLSLWFVLAVARGAQHPASVWPAVAAVCGTLAGLAKITTFLIHLPPAGLLAWWLTRNEARILRRGSRLVFSLGLPAAIALGTAAAWIRHADEVKHANPFTGFLTSTELAKWNWGTLEQRFSAEFWIEFWRNLSAFILAEIALVPLLVGAVVATPTLRRVALAGVACFLVGPLLFSNLFHRHDYYYFANATLLLFGAGILLGALWGDDRLPRSVRAALLAAFFGAQSLILHRGYADYLRRPPTPPPGIAALIRAVTPPEGVIVVYGWDWNGLIPYYAERRAVMIPRGRELETEVLDDVLSRMPPLRVAGMLVHQEALGGDGPLLRDRAERFGLDRAPLATSEAGNFYLASDLWAAAEPSLRERSFEGVRINGLPPKETERDLVPVPAEELDLEIFSPRPSAGLTRFGLSAGGIAGRPVLNAHAPSELILRPPPGSRRVEAEFGLPEPAFSGGTAVTDGVGVEIFERRPGGRVRVLFRRELDPARRSEDRGLQRIDLPEAGPFSGELVFRFSPGPKGEVTNDWSYWGRITIR